MKTSKTINRQIFNNNKLTKRTWTIVQFIEHILKTCYNFFATFLPAMFLTYIGENILAAILLLYGAIKILQDITNTHSIKTLFDKITNKIK